MNFLKSISLLSIFLGSILSYPQVIDESEEKVSHRIVGGEPADPGEFPWIVSIEVSPTVLNAQYQHACGGSILNSEWIVTAGHCSVANRNRYRIVIGVNDLAHPTGSEQIVWPVEIITHPNYDPKTIDYDIALMRVTPAIVFDTYVKPVQLPNPALFPIGTAESAGWGLLHQTDKETPDLLQKIELPIIPTIECSSIYAKLNLTITENMFCAGFQEGKSVCNGDSGGPLMCDCLEGRENCLCGIVSWGIPCARQGYPGVFTKVTQFLPFIRQYVF